MTTGWQQRPNERKIARDYCLQSCKMLERKLPVAIRILARLEERLNRPVRPAR